MSFLTYLFIPSYVIDRVPQEAAAYCLVDSVDICAFPTDSIKPSLSIRPYYSIKPEFAPSPTNLLHHYP